MVICGHLKLCDGTNSWPQRFADMELGRTRYFYLLSDR